MPNLTEEPKERQALVSLTLKRVKMSHEYIRPWHEKWVRYYKIYRSISDAAQDEDEPNIFLPYAFGIVEQIVSKSTEPILQLKPPCRVQPKRNNHKKQADNFGFVARQYFSSSRWQMDYTESNKELAITGNAWEVDEYVNDYRQGKKWAKVKKTGIMASLKSFAGKVLPIQSEYDYEGLEEVVAQYPHKVGYNTRFPSIFDVWPEPRVKNVHDMHWIIEQEREVALSDLMNQYYTDPVTHEKKQVYDFTELLHDAGKHEDGAITPKFSFDTQTDYGDIARRAMAGIDERSETTNDMDRVHLLHIWEKDRMWTIAQGKYLVRKVDFPFHVSRLPFRLRRYTTDKEFLYGIGAIEPAEHLFYELNDIHNLSMENWIRIIQKMVAIHIDAVPFPDDFKPRAGGKVRVKTSSRVQDAIMPIEHQDITGSMLNQESNTKGFIEWVLSVSDLSPGTQGTKQTHKTLGGLIEVQQSLAVRFGTLRRMQLANFQDQMWFMEKLFSQFQFEPISVTTYGPSGETAIMEMSMEDIWTDGLGFDFIIEHDPSYGDESVLRNQLMVLQDVFLKYEQYRNASGDPNLAKVNMPKLMERILQSFGWYDTSEMLQAPNGILDPSAEFEMMMVGSPVAPNPNENLTDHLITHMIQLNSPLVQKGLETGKIGPESMLLLKAHIEATQGLINETSANPMAMGQLRIKQNIQREQMAARSTAMGGDVVDVETPMNGQMERGMQ